MMLRLSMLLVLSAALTACASGNYTPPAPPAFEVQRTATLPLEQAWQTVLAGAPALGYQVRETDRQAGTITFNFGRDNPGKYVDCGDFRGSTGSTSFNGKWLNWVTTTRKAQLTGLMQITLQALDENQTQASVRAGYALTLPASIAPGFAGADFAFATDSSDTVAITDILAGGQPNRTCRPSGAAEKEILSLL